MIYVVGNSHCNFFTHSHPGNGQVVQGDLFTSIPMWGIVAYNFYEHHMNACISKLRSLNIQSDDYVLLVLGEVDCRYFLPM